MSKPASFGGAGGSRWCCRRSATSACGGGLFGLAPAGPDDLAQSQSHVVGQSGEHTHVA